MSKRGHEEPDARADDGGDWSPNQQAARQRIASAASVLVARDGLAACTIRAVAEEAGLPKSTVHYYVRDANEMVDLAVQTFLSELAEATRARMDAAADGREALRRVVEVFMESDKRPRTLGDPTLWAAYTAHAWSRGERALLARSFDTFTALFVDALGRCGVEDAPARGLSVYLYLLGAVQRGIALPVPPDEVTDAVSRLSGVALETGAVDRRRSRATGSTTRR